jgi:hypothetical protein
MGLAAATKQSAYRRRVKAGRLVIPIEVDEDLVVEALKASERLSPHGAVDRSILSRELARIIWDWAEEWTFEEER